MCVIFVTVGLWNLNFARVYYLGVYPRIVRLHNTNNITTFVLFSVLLVNDIIHPMSMKAPPANNQLFGKIYTIWRVSHGRSLQAVHPTSNPFRGGGGVIYQCFKSERSLLSARPWLPKLTKLNYNDLHLMIS